jgi:RNA polymerase sigma-70 factor (ECF subfamily)
MEAILFFADLNGRSVAAAALRSIALSPDGNAIGEQQFQALYNANARPIHAYLLGVTANKDVADDVLQETWFRFLQRHPARMPFEEARPYLFRIATNLLRDRWRARQEAQWPEDFDPGHVRDMDAQLDVRHVMQALKPRERELLWLAYVEGMSHQEIAIATGLTALSVRPLLFRARKKAASLLRPEGNSL